MSRIEFQAPGAAHLARTIALLGNRLACASLLLLAIAATSAFASTAAAQERPDMQKRVFVHNHFEIGPLTPGAFVCPELGTPFESRYVIGTHPEDNWTGTAFVQGCLYNHPDGSITYRGTETDTATHPDCGSGTVTWAFEGGASKPDASGNRTDAAVWSIVPGTGEGDFADIDEGSGTISGTVTATFDASGEWKGIVYC